MSDTLFQDPPMAEMGRSSSPLRDLWDNERVRGFREVFGPAICILVGAPIASRLVLNQAFVSPFEEPGLYLYGILLGLLGALVAVGMGLIYRANRILNFAQGELGLVPTIFALNLILYSSFPYLLGLAVGLVMAALLGAIVELAIIRRFFKAPRLILTVATIGVSQLLTVAALAVPMLWSKDPLSFQGDVVPFDMSFVVAPITFRANHVLALVLAPLALAGVAIFLRYTNVGVAVRASAERADRASLLGIPVKRLQTVVWVVAALLSFLGVFLKAGMVGLPFASNQGFGTTSFGALLAALAALTLGRFTNLPCIAVSAVALGILEQVVIWNNGNNPSVIYPVMAVVILVGLAVRKTGQSRAEQDTASTWQAADEIRPLPRELRKVPEVAVAKWGGLLLFAFVLYRLPTFGFMDSGMTLKAAAVVCFAIVGISIVMLTGWAGQVSLGQMAFAGVGGAVGAVATKNWGLDLTLALVIAGIAGSVIAIVVGLPALRVRGLFLAVTTLAFAITCSNYLLNPNFFGWIPQGRIPRPPLFGRLEIESQTGMYYVCLVCLGLTILAVGGIRRSRTGRVLLAMRENERGVQSYGINVTRVKLMAFALSGFLAAMAGCLLVHVNHVFSVDEYGAATSFNVFTSAVVGGLGSITGGILGALFSRGGVWFLQGSWQLLPSAIGVLVVLLVFPGGLGGMFFKLRDMWLRSVGRRNGIIVPSLIADVRQDPIPVEHAEQAAEHHDEVVGSAVGDVEGGGGAANVAEQPAAAGQQAGAGASQGGAS